MGGGGGEGAGEQVDTFWDLTDVGGQFQLIMEFSLRM